MTDQAAAPVFTKGRDLDATAGLLRAWLGARLDDDGIEVADLELPSGAGVSNETILFAARSRATGDVHELVLRIAPATDAQLFLDPDLRLQYDLMTALERLGTVPVPHVLWYEEDPGVLGRPFFVMRRLEGRVPVSLPVYNATGWLVEATPAQRRTAWLSAMRHLAAVHAVPVETVALLDEPARGATGLEQQLSYWTDLATWVSRDEVPDVVTGLFEWLRANAPTDEAPGLSWGDARIGNMMFGDDYEVVGVMDWEQASLGGAMNDLGWWLCFDDLHSVEQGVPRLDGLGTRQETIDLWQELTGRTVGDLRWHEVFAGLKVGLLAIRTGQVLAVDDLHLPQRHASIYFTRSCRLADLPEPVDAA
jgi:aminoglycoside phosphotransferase (APT) family kinase protein